MTWLLTISVYSAVMYSFMRTCMQETKRKDPEPGLPATWAFLVSALWPLFMTYVVICDIFEGYREFVRRGKN